MTWRYPTISELMINEEIRDREVRLIDENGEQLGIVTSKEALDMAHEKDLDLVKIAPQANPPVCKIMNYSKYRFDQNKREKEARKKQKIVEVKEVRMTPNTEEHDLNTKVKSAVKFLKNGDKVKVSVRFRGRELSRTEIGKVVLDQFAERISEFGDIDKAPKMEGRSMVMFVSPKRQ
ncbi:MAG: translation initiation factor IF-3 [Firmicutes bacterium]|nr:translation initiation factor IF-3 [Bacillota bacterium]